MVKYGRLTPDPACSRFKVVLLDNKKGEGL
ncbi:hypothetical protein ACVIRO_006789 [Rhizobium ruizarguesonis]|jgi:hypothetical protein